jgi:hypothetical protein
MFWEMPPGLDRSDWYQQGIRRAEQDGLIHYAHRNVGSRVAVADNHRHISHEDGAPLLLKYTNTRPLSFIARQILDLYGSNPDFRFLELGPGAGVACATVNRLYPHAKIDTVSLTPLNPYLRFRCDDLHYRIADPVSHEKNALRFYDSCSPPFVRNQYIGKFPREVSLQKNDYHFIYENHGAIFYSLHPNETGEPSELARSSIAAALSHLRCDGTMLIMASDGAYVMEDVLQSVAPDTDVIVTCKRTTVYHSLPCIVARRESPLSMRLREDGLLSTSERVLQLDLQTLEDVISKIRGLRQ